MVVQLLRQKLYTRKRQFMLALAVTTLAGVAGIYTLQSSHAATYAASFEAESGTRVGNYGVGDTIGASGGASVKFGGGAVSPPALTTNRPAQAGAIMYGDPPNYASAAAYAHPGALIAPGRMGYDSQVYKDISAAGGSVILYIDVMIDASYGTYHQLLLTNSACGPAVSRWPGSPSANQWGYLNDFRVGGVLQTKLECVLEKMVSDNPHMAGWFADDVGSRSWYPNINWDSWSAADQQAYRDGAIEITKTFRKVADRHGLIFLVNGTWAGGSLASSGGGYPDMSQSGNAFADGGVVEHHATSELPYFTSYACSAQWATQSPVTKGKSLMLAISSSPAERDAYAASNCFAYLTSQTEDQYSAAPAPWTNFHSNGLPSKVGGPVSF